MGDTTTFAALIAEPSSEKIFLAEINPAEHLLGWTLTDGRTNTYEIIFLNEVITLADDSTETLRKVVSSVEEDGTALTKTAPNLDFVEAIPGTWWQNTANGKLYIHTSGSDDPKGYTIIGFFWLYFATKGIILNSRYYEPYIAQRGIPGLRQSNPNLYWGVISISGGNLVLLNNRGYFDQIARKFIWIDKTVKILLGGDSLPYGEYELLYTQKILDKVFSRRKFQLKIASPTFGLLRTVPINKFWTTDYPDLDPAAEGRPIPYYYSTYTAQQAPIATCIDTAYDTNQYQFKMCDHAIKSITQVYIDYNDGAGWQTIAHANEDLANAKFTITSADFKVGTTRVKVAFEGKASGGSVIEGAPEIVEDFLEDILGYAAADLNAASFTASKAESDVVLNVPIEKETSALKIIENITKSDLAFFDEDESGLFRYRSWIPYIGGTYSELDETDFLGTPEIREASKQLYYQIRIGYAYSCALQEHQYHEESDLESRYKYGRQERLLLDTYIRSQSDALTLAERLKVLMKDPSPELKTDLKLPVIDKLIGDKVRISLARAPFESASGWSKRYFEIIGRAISYFPVKSTLKLIDLREFGISVGFWTDDSAPVWGSAADSDKASDGYWCDDDGYAAPGEPDSYMVSRWW